MLIGRLMLSPITLASRYRVTSKGDKKRWNNAKGEGTLFSIDLLDEEGGEIRATFFKEACEKFYDVIQPQKVYTFSGPVRHHSRNC